MTHFSPTPAPGPVSYDNLLDLFEAYVGTISAPLMKVRDLIENEFGYRQGDIFSNLLTPVNDAHQMVGRLAGIRRARQSRGTVCLELSPFEACLTAIHAREVQGLFDDTAAALGAVHRTVIDNPQYLAGEWAMPAGTLETTNLAIRTLLTAAEREAEQLVRHTKLLEKATARLETEEEAA